MKIKIILEDDLGSLLAKRETENWEVAEMNLDSLKRWWQKNEFEREQELADITQENLA